MRRSFVVEQKNKNRKKRDEFPKLFIFVVGALLFVIIFVFIKSSLVTESVTNFVAPLHYEAVTKETVNDNPNEEVDIVDSVSATTSVDTTPVPTKNNNASVTPSPTSIPTPTPTPTQKPTPVPTQISKADLSNNFGFAISESLLHLSQDEMNRALDDMVSVGATWIRFDMDWSSVQPNSKREHNWQQIDRLVSSARSRNLKILAIVDNTPLWARPADCKHSSKCMPRDFDEFAEFAGAAVKRYSSKGVHDWEVWNEPNISAFWLPHPDPAVYTSLLRYASKAMRAADSSINILTGSLAPAETKNGNIAPLDFIDSMYKSGAKDLFDSVGFHPYSFPVPAGYLANWNAWQQMSQTARSVRSIMAQNGDSDKKIWITEYGAPTGGPRATAYKDNYNLGNRPDHVTEDLQAQIFSEAYGLYKSYSWAGPMMWYSYKDIGTSSETIENFFGILRYDGSKKPIYNVMKEILHSRE